MEHPFPPISNKNFQGWNEVFTNMHKQKYKYIYYKYKVELVVSITLKLSMKIPTRFVG
jgi:hypothetical protein